MKARLELAQKAVILEGGRLLMVRKGINHPFHPNVWEIPGGRLEPGETLEAGIVREVMEEVGASVRPGPLLTSWTWHLQGKTDPTTLVALTRLCVRSGEAEPRLTALGRAEHIAEVAWVPLTKLGSLAMDREAGPAIRAAVDLVATFG